MSGEGRKRAVQELIARCYEYDDSVSLRLQFLSQLRKLMPVDAAFLSTVDPATLLITSAVSDEIPGEATPQFLDNEFQQTDVNKFRDLLQVPGHVDWLDRLTSGQRCQSARYRDILSPLGMGDELRAALVSDGACWGFICLHREDVPRGFTPNEARLVASLTSHLAAGLRRALVVESLSRRPAENDEGPGVILLAEDLSIVGSTPAAERWLSEVGEDDWPGTLPLPSAVYALVAQLLAVTQDAPATPAPVPRARLRTRRGRWLALQASQFATSHGEGRIAVVLQPASPTEIGPLIVQAYGLTAREAQLLRLVLAGRSTRQISNQLRISPNTVQDHLKSIFTKTGVGSRGELLARVFFDHYRPGTQEDGPGHAERG